MTNSIKTLLLILMLSCPPLFSQGGPGQWVGEQFLVSLGSDFLSPTKAFLDENNDVQKTIPKLSSVTGFPVPSKYLAMIHSTFWLDDALYSCASGAVPEKNEDGTEVDRITFAKWKDEAWHFIGSLSIKHDYVTAIPCENNRFIVISRNNDLTGNTGRDRSPFCRISLRPSSQEFKIDGAIDHKIDESMFAPEWFQLASSSQIALTDKYAVAINDKTGIYWVFSLEKASMTRSGRIFGKVTSEMISKGGFISAIFQAHPEKDGNILISAQDDALFTTDANPDYVKDINEMIQANPYMTMDEIQKILNVRVQEKRDRSPFVVWYRIYPESGKVQKLSNPPEGGALYAKGVQIWRPMPDGSVKTGWFDKTLPLGTSPQ
jgi:hypothetical protein